MSAAQNSLPFISSESSLLQSRPENSLDVDRDVIFVLGGKGYILYFPTLTPSVVGAPVVL